MSTVDQQLEDVKATIDETVPGHITVSEVTYEGPQLVIYTRDPGAFAAEGDLVRQLASKVRKRISVRPTPDVLTPTDDAEAEIREIVPDEAGLGDLTFHADTGEVVIEAERPGSVIGPRGSRLQEIRQAVGWAPEVVRTSPMDAPAVADIRRFVEADREERQDILERIGRQIHREPMSDEQWVRVTTLGGAHEVGRAAYVVSTADSRVLVDCGYKPGADGETPYLDVPEALGAGASTLDAVVLTHAHLDHSAYVPLLFEQGYDGPVYCTEPTRDLLGLLTLDYCQTSTVAPYDPGMVRTALKHCIPIEYGDVTDIAPDVKLTLHSAGHVLGSAVCHFHVGDGLYNVAVSGDIQYESSRLFDGAVNDFPRVETLVLESTYGGRNDYQTDRVDAERKLNRLVERTDGTVVVPVEALGTAQELMLALDEAMQEGDVADLPVYLDGLVWEVSALHTVYPEFLKNSVKDRVLGEDNPFLADRFERIADADERAEIAGERAVVLAPAGDLTRGPATEWLDLAGTDEDNALALVGYHPRGTPARRVANGQREVRVGSETIELDAEIEVLDGLTGHADRQGLENFVKTMHPRPEKVLCVHGDNSAAQDLSSGLYHDYNLRTFAPENLETFRFR